MSVRGTRTRRWCVTDNQPPADAANYLSDELKAGIKFAIWQLELVNHLHIQAFIIFKDAITLSAAKSRLPNGVHLEKANGSVEDNVKYCSKTDSHVAGPWRHGEQPTEAGGNSASFSERVVEQLRAGRTPESLLREGEIPLVMYGAVSRAAGAFQQNRRLGEKPTVYVIVGATGTGKSTWAHTRWPDAYEPRLGGASYWWNGYAGESTILFDEFDSSKLNINSALRLCDKWSFYGDAKLGPAVSVIASTIVFCSNDPLMCWWPLAGGPQRNAFQRRITATLDLKTGELMSDELLERSGE